MVKWLIPTVLVVAGVCVFAAGLAYGVVMVGVPTPDAPPPVAAREARDTYVAEILMATGAVVSAVGVASVISIGIIQAIRRHAPDAEPGAAADRPRG